MGVQGLAWRPPRGRIEEVSEQKDNVTSLMPCAVKLFRGIKQTDMKHMNVLFTKKKKK